MRDFEQHFFPNSERFVLQRRLGEGGFGIVYQVYDCEKKRHVALKALKELNADTLYRFKQEFRSLADLNHPNLVTLHELTSQQGQWFFTMELVEGIDFAQFVREENEITPNLSDLETPPPPSHPARPARTLPPLSTAKPYALTLPSNSPTPQVPPSSTPQTNTLQPPPHPAPATYNESRLFAALQQLIQGVDALHRAGKLHRDLKPSNVLVTSEERVVILDLGLAMDVGGDRLYTSYQIAGTPAYMPPEQALQQTPTEASDWYSVGVMLYEAITGQLPFHGEPLTLLHLKRTTQPSQPSAWVTPVSPELDALCLDLLHPDPLKRPNYEEICQRLGLHNPPKNKERERIPLIGRGEAMLALQKAFQRVQQGESITVHVTGPSGLGKSMLVRRFLQQLRHYENQTLLFTARCYKQESMPYKALDSLVDTMSRYLSHLPNREVVELLPTGIYELSLLFPVLRRVDAIAQAIQSAIPVTDVQEMRKRAFRAFRLLLQGFSRKRCIVIFLDDLQWGDVDSARLLQEILQPPNAPPLLLLASYRSEDREGSPFLQSFPECPPFSEQKTEVLPLRELAPKDAQELALYWLGGPESQWASLAPAIVNESGGNPYFIETFVRYLLRHQPPPSDTSEPSLLSLTMDEVWHAQLEKLPSFSRRLLEFIAVAGQPLRRHLLPQLLATPGEEYQEKHDEIRALQAQQLLRLRGNAPNEELETYHNRIRETILAHISPTQLQMLHQALAQALAEEPDIDPERLAIHHQQSGDPSQAKNYLQIAAKQAYQALAFARAARLYKRMLDLLPQEDSERCLYSQKHGDALANAGLSHDAARAYQVAAETTTQVYERLEFQRMAAAQLLRSGHIDEGVQVLSKVFDRVGLHLAPTPMHAFFSWLFRRFRIFLRGMRFHEQTHSPLPKHQQISIDTARSVAMLYGMVDPIRGADFQAQHLMYALNAGDPYRIALALTVEIGYSSLRGWQRRNKTQKLLHKTMLLAKRIHHPHAAGNAFLAAGIAAYTHGQWQKAQFLCKKAESILREQCTGVFWELANAQIYRLNALLFLGRFDQIQEQLPSMLQEAESRGDRYTQTFLSAGILAKLQLALDETDQAQQAIESSQSTWSQQGFNLQHYIQLLAQGELDLYQGKAQQAWETLQARWGDMRRSLLLHAQFNHIEIHYLRGRIALSIAANTQETTRQKMFLKEANRSADKIRGRAVPWALPFAFLLDAGIAMTQGKQDNALAQLFAAETRFELAEMELHAHAIRLQRSMFAEPKERKKLQQETFRWFAQHSVLAPRRMTRALLPGTWPNITVHCER